MGLQQTQGLCGKTVGRRSARSRCPGKCAAIATMKLELPGDVPRRSSRRGPARILGLARATSEALGWATRGCGVHFDVRLVRLATSSRDVPQATAQGNGDLARGTTEKL